MTKQEFARLCYLVLMQNGEGIRDKTLGYIKDKSYLLDAGYDAFGALDPMNQGIVVGYLSRWRIEVPKEIKPFIQKYYPEQV